MKRKIVAGVFAAVVSAGLLGAAAAAVDPGQSGNICDPYNERTYTQTGYEWGTSDSGTISNSSGATVSRAIARSASGTASVTVSAEVQASGSVVIAEIQAKLGVSVTASVTLTKTDTFTVAVPAYSTVSYRDGLIKRTYIVTVRHIASNCKVSSTTYGTVVAPQKYAEVRNV
ncbi:hypothetical protein [Kitasatospora sp. NPDC088346]|uniref:hypothetical protein n=1 Tax=Kitasatospora sp. NPDC088346 TaxID=3364073 RepID=UPI003811A7E9